MKRTTMLVTSLVVAAAALPLTFSTTTASAAAAKKGDTLTVGQVGDIKSFAVPSSEFGNRVLFYQAPYDTLIQMTPDGTLKPWLATKWSYNADNTVLTMTLRTGVKFTDGTAFDAAAAAANLNRFSKGDSPDASNMANLQEAKAVNKTTLQITLKAADPAMLNYMSRNAGLMQSPKSFGASDEKANPVGTGPYILNKGKTTVGSVYTFDANPGYWNKPAQLYKHLVLKIISDPTAVVNALKAKEVDAETLINNDPVAEVQGAGLTIAAQELDWVGISLVDRDGKMGTPLKDVRVRQAINYAFDRAAILKGYGVGFGTATTQVFRKSSAGFDPALDKMYTYDPAKAKALLKEAGYADGFELAMPKISVLGEAVFAIIQQQLGDVGIKLKYTEVPLNDFFTQILTPKFPAYFMFLEQNGNDWQAMNFLLTPKAVWNPSHYSTPETDKLIEQIRTAKDAKSAAPLVKALGKIVTEQAWFVPGTASRLLRLQRCQGEGHGTDRQRDPLHLELPAGVIRRTPLW